MRLSIIIGAVLASLWTFGQGNNLVVLRKGQKTFLERGDYMKDKIYAVSEKDDTVEIVVADQAFYKFKRGDFEAWAITNQLDESRDILAKQSEVVYPFVVRTDKVITVYQEGKLGAEKMIDLKKGQEIKVNSKSGYFYAVEFNGKSGFIHISFIVEPEITHYHIMRAIFHEINKRQSPLSQEQYVRSNGKLISKYQASGYTSETYRIGNTYYTITTYNGKTELSSYTVY